MSVTVHPLPRPAMAQGSAGREPAVPRSCEQFNAVQPSSERHPAPTLLPQEPGRDSKGDGLRMRAVLTIQLRGPSTGDSPLWLGCHVPAARGSPAAAACDLGHERPGLVWMVVAVPAIGQESSGRSTSSSRNKGRAIRCSSHVAITPPRMSAAVRTQPRIHSDRDAEAWTVACAAAMDCWASC